MKNRSAGKTLTSLNRDRWINSNPNAVKRYHPQRWRKTAKRAKALTRGKCVCCSSPATEVHHAYYGLPIVYPIVILSPIAILINPMFAFGLALVPILWGYSLPISGFEIPLWQVFPLCDLHHSNRSGCAHNFGNYRAFKSNPWANRNQYGYLWKLRIAALSKFL